ncbi:MAG: NAD-dependent succinate-semialdehyde dehydrogenase [Alphaproteobacteria bacterium]|nr:NAD-dependent succinate-semialdehyde dehydrogenase [Alphaproteobacteria bacterium]
MPYDNDLFRMLKDASLFRQQAYLDGAWCGADSGATEAVENPANGSRIGAVPSMGEAETRRAIAAASAAFGGWRGLTATERARALRRWNDLILANRDDLALIMTLEQGKPLAESLGEIDYAASFVEWFAEEGKRAYGDVIPSHLAGRRLIATREPIGVAAAITPWNFPSAMITRKAAAALAAGCPMIVRPAMETPFSALALAVLAERANIPRGVFQVVTGKATAISNALMASPEVRAVSFTGSTEVGRILLAGGAATVKKMSMELGGHAPFIVFEDVDVAATSADAIGAKFVTTGQDCLAANRIFVHERVYEEFAADFAARAAALKVGDGLEPGVELGPLIDERAVEKLERQVADALAKGARLLAGGKRHAKGGRFFEPTVLADATPEMEIFREETFGPVAALFRFRDEDAVVRQANDSIYGLAAYVYSADLARAWRVGEQLDYGMVAFNGVKMTGPPIPFGGMKQSGLGREGSRHGLDEYMQLKYFCVAGIDRPVLKQAG